MVPIPLHRLPFYLVHRHASVGPQRNHRVVGGARCSGCDWAGLGGPSLSNAWKANGDRKLARSDLDACVLSLRHLGAVRIWKTKNLGLGARLWVDGSVEQV